MITTLALGGVGSRYIHQDQVVKSTVRRVAVKAAMLKKVGLRAVFRTALLWCVYLVFPLPLWQTLGMQIIILALPVCSFLLWRSSDIIRIKVLIFSYNGLSQLYNLGLWAILFHVWAVFFHRVNVTLSVPLILGGTQKVQISKGGNKYTVQVNVPIIYCFRADSTLDRDIVIALLNEARGLDGKKIIIQQALAEGFGLKDRREIDNRMQQYRKSGKSLMGIVAPHISRAWVLTEEVKEAIEGFWTKNWWATEREVFEHLQHIGFFKPDAKFCIPTIRAAVGNDFLKLRAHVKKAFSRGLISYREDELVRQLFDLVQSQYDLLKSHNLLPQIEQLKLETLKTFSKANTMKKELKQTARIRNIRTQVMNPQIQDSHLSKPLDAIKLYGYFACSYGYIAYHLKVAKSTVFYWAQSFILCLVSKGAFDAHGIFYPLPWIDTQKMALLFRSDGFFNAYPRGRNL